MKDLSKLCIHTITTKPWSIEEALDQYCERGIGGISIWQNAVEGRNLHQLQEKIRSYPIEIVSYVRGGFFAHSSETERIKAVGHNKRMIEEAAILGAPLLVLVCGSAPDQPLNSSRQQIQDGIEAIIPYAEALDVKLGIEPLHPMYADTRSAINTLAQANTIIAAIQSPFVGAVVDVYHLWWDADLQKELQRCGDKIFAYHICDWRVPTKDMLNDREIMGKGCIPLDDIGSWVKQAGFNGFDEVEIFSDRYWAKNQTEFLNEIMEAYLALQ
jgi:sugar phosphate isomerase/epimerase